jgi:nicotinamide-nucleotide amidase
VNAEIITIGNEILSGRTVDTNFAYLAAQLETRGVPVGQHQTVGDQVEDIARALKTALARASLVIVTGGLGPTPDDVTRKAIAQALGRPLALDHDVLESIRERWVSLGGSEPMPGNNEVQALVPRGARVLRNTQGTAPGLLMEEDGKAVFVVPGVPGEMRSLTGDSILPWLDAQARHPVRYLTLRTCGIREAVLAQRLAEVPELLPDCQVAYLPSIGGVDIRIRLPEVDAERVAEVAERARQEITGRVGNYIFTEGTDSLERVVGDLLLEREYMIALAESCTGGMVAARITTTPGSSLFFEGGVVSYSNRAKEEMAGVAHELLVEHGAVSEPVARALAEGIAERTGAAVGVGITGIAGPGGGTEEKPVGTVHIAAVAPEGKAHRRYRFPGSRDGVRERSVTASLDMVRRLLLGIDD